MLRGTVQLQPFRGTARATIFYVLFKDARVRAAFRGTKRSFLMTDVTIMSLVTLSNYRLLLGYMYIYVSQ